MTLAAFGRSQTRIIIHACRSVRMVATLALDIFCCQHADSVCVGSRGVQEEIIEATVPLSCVPPGGVAGEASGIVLYERHGIKRTRMQRTRPTRYFPQTRVRRIPMARRTINQGITVISRIRHVRVVLSDRPARDQEHACQTYHHHCYKFHLHSFPIEWLFRYLPRGIATSMPPSIEVLGRSDKPSHQKTTNLSDIVSGRPSSLIKTENARSNDPDGAPQEANTKKQCCANDIFPKVPMTKNQ